MKRFQFLPSGVCMRVRVAASGALEYEFMQIRVLFFGQLKEITGVAQEDAELSEGARVDDLFERYGRRFPRLAEFRSSIAASVNQEYADWRTKLAPGDQVAFLPPVSGG
jgi:molybdopterin converting factor subunit 1